MRTVRAYRWIAMILLLSLAGPLRGGKSAEQRVRSPLSPQEALEHFVVPSDLEIELVASEPQVVDPVAVAFDEHGRLWVVEMRDYPFGPQDGASPQSRIKLLEDRDGDGHFETAHTFADGLLFATGVQPWRGGVIVTLSGEIAWLADTDGDHRADVHQTWFRGFAERNPQLRANDPTFWYDGNVYVAGGLFYGGRIETVHDAWRNVNGSASIDLGQRDFRFNPHTGRATAIAGGAQFGLAFDVHGNRFICSNSRPVEHVVLEEHYLTRNPGVTETRTNQIVVASGEATRLYPLSRQETTSYLHEGQFTAACGVLIQGGSGLPEEYRGNAFICEPTANLVHREVLTADGVSFTASPAHDGVEFLASRDGWFRPVFVAEGPDGALYVADMYRAVIEHPEWFPDLASRGDLTAGNDRGRIWRIRDRGQQAGDGRQESLAERGRIRELVALLDHPNAWHRQTAARLLYERRDEVKGEWLREVQRGGPSADGRIAALLVLAGLDLLNDDDLLAALDDPEPGVRRIATQLVESRLSVCEPLRRRVAELATNAASTPRERFQALLSLAVAPDERLARALQSVAASEAVADPWLRAAILCSLVEDHAAQIESLCAALAGAEEELARDRLPLVEQMAEQVGGSGSDEEVLAILVARSAADGQPQRPESIHALLDRSCLLGLARGLSRRGNSLAEWMSRQSEVCQRWWQSRLDEAATLALNSDADDWHRQQALELLGYGTFKSAGDKLQLLVHDTSPKIRATAIRAVAGFDRPEAAEMLLADIAEATPGHRRAAFEAIVGGRAMTAYLLEQVASGHIAADLIDAGARQRLWNHPHAELRGRARMLLPQDDTDREHVIEAYQAAVAQPGDAAHGRQVFERNCAGCHRVGGTGTAVGPDIADNYNRTREQLLVAILDPNRLIDSSFEAYVVSTASGRTLQGLLVEETASAVTLKETEGKTTTIARQEIHELFPTGVSLMPTGIEQDIDLAAMTDLLTFLKEWRRLR